MSLSVYTVGRRLRKLDEFSTVTDMELLEVVAGSSPAATRGRQRILAALLSQVGFDSTSRLIETRKIEKRQEIKNNTPDEDKRIHENVFNAVFAKIANRELEQCGYSDELVWDQSSSTLKCRKGFLEIMNFLLNRMAAGDEVAGKEKAQKGMSPAPTPPPQTNQHRTSSPSLKELKSSRPSSSVRSSSSLSAIHTSGRSLTPLVGRGRDSFSDSAPTSLESLQSLKPLQKKGSADPESLTEDIEVAEVLNLTNARRRIQALEESLKQSNEKYEKLYGEHTTLQDQYRKAVEEVVDPSATLEANTLMLDRRRVMILKSQLVQLERERELLKEAAARDDGGVAEICKDLRTAKDTVKSALAEITRDPKVPAKHTEQIKTALSAITASLKALSHSYTASRSTKRGVAPFIRGFLGSTEKNEEEESGFRFEDNAEANSLHLKDLSRLESQLHGLRSQLAALYQCLNTGYRTSNPHIFDERIHEQYEKSLFELQSAMDSLLSFSTMAPMAPYPSLNKSKSNRKQSLPAATDIISAIPNLSSYQKTKLEQALNSLYGIVRKEEERLVTEKQALQEELERNRIKPIGPGKENINTKDTEEKEFKKVLRKSILEPVEHMNNRLVNLNFTQREVSQYLNDLEIVFISISKSLKRVT
ncbi:hypothetical protein HDV05_008423 [Chytridiales sp. JEL 0842]|nr:hypothetical protein HDV05_008423 [Chytridiales sp. JEL 0842]